jgi:16S rRNA A1518/A1519 N6-dimethyltransferase RsmA/KsgA/DIM1 with predicted DNA glycosylase/AP lyase activity
VKILEGEKRVRISDKQKTVQTVIDIKLYKQFTDAIFEEDPKKTVKDKLKELIVDYIKKHQIKSEV